MSISHLVRMWKNYPIVYNDNRREKAGITSYRQDPNRKINPNVPDWSSFFFVAEGIAYGFLTHLAVSHFGYDDLANDPALLVGVPVASVAARYLQVGKHYFAESGKLYDAERKGNIAFHEGSNEKAIEHLEEAIELDKENVDLYRKLGVAQLNSLNPGLALSAFKEANRLDSLLWEVHLGIARSSHALGNFEDAIAHYDLFFALNHDEEEFSAKVIRPLKEFAAKNQQITLRDQLKIMRNPDFG